MAFRAATSRRAGTGILGTLAVLLATALAPGRSAPVLAATPIQQVTPAVVRYGTPGFPKTAKSWPANAGNLLAGGAGGTANLVQQASVTPNARYDIAGRKTGQARARLPAGGRHGSRGRDAGTR